MNKFTNKVDDLFGKAFEEISQTGFDTKAVVPEFTQISQEATEIVYPSWVSIARLKYYAFANPNLIFYKPCQPESSAIKEIKALPDRLRAIFERTRNRNIRFTYCLLPGPTTDELEVYANALVPLGSLLNTSWYLESLYSQRKANLKLGFKELNKTGFGGNVFLSGDITDKGIDLDRAVSVELEHRRLDNWFFKLNMFVNINNPVSQVFSITHVHRLHPQLSIGGMRAVDGTLHGAVRVTPTDSSIVTLKASKKRARATYYQKLNSWLALATDVEWRKDVENSVQVGLGCEAKSRYFVTRTSVANDGLVSLIVEGIPRYTEQLGVVRFVLGTYADYNHKTFGGTFGIQLN